MDVLLGRKKSTRHTDEEDHQIQMLHRMFESREAEANASAAELSLVKLQKTRMREFVDGGLEEVDRVSRVNEKGANESFDWKSQGEPMDIPVLRRSRVVYTV